MSTELIVRKLNKKKVAGAIIILAVLFLLIINSIALHIRKKSNESYVNDVFSSQNFEKQVGKEMVDEEIDYGYLYKAKYPSTNIIELNMKINLKEQEIKNRFIKNYKKSFKQKLSGDIFYDAVDYYSFQGDNGTMSVIFVENIFDKGNVCIEKNVYHENFSFDDKDTLKDTYIFNGDYKSALKDLLIADIKRVENTGYFKENNEHPEKRIAHKALAHEIITDLHGEESYNEAVKISEALFSGDIKNFTAKEVEMAFGGLTPFEINSDLNIVDLLIDGNICSSKREAREFINNGSITINGEKITDLEFIVTKDKCIENKYIVVRRGKKKYFVGEYK